MTEFFASINPSDFEFFEMYDVDFWNEVAYATIASLVDDDEYYRVAIKFEKDVDEVFTDFDSQTSRIAYHNVETVAVQPTWSIIDETTKALATYTPSTNQMYEAQSSLNYFHEKHLEKERECYEPF